MELYLYNEWAKQDDDTYHRLTLIQMFFFKFGNYRYGFKVTVLGLGAEFNFKLPKIVW